MVFIPYSRPENLISRDNLCRVPLVRILRCYALLAEIQQTVLHGAIFDWYNNVWTFDERGFTLQSMEKATISEGVSEIQERLTQEVMSMHHLAYQASTNDPEVGKLRINELVHCLLRINSLYRGLPHGCHLEMEVTPEVYWRLGGSANYPWLRQEKAKSAVRYYLRIGRFVQDRRILDANRTVLNLTTISNFDQAPYFSLLEASRNLISAKGSVLRPHEIMNVFIAPD